LKTFLLSKEDEHHISVLLKMEKYMHYSDDANKKNFLVPGEVEFTTGGPPFRYIVFAKNM
jgi:hypothetical protein